MIIFKMYYRIYQILTAQKILIIWKKTTLLPLIWMKKQRENMKKLQEETKRNAEPF